MSRRLFATVGAVAAVGAAAGGIAAASPLTGTTSHRSIPAAARSAATTSHRSAPTAARSASTVTVRSSRFGRVLFDGRGRALYLFTRDRGKRSSCYGACAKAWPPFLVDRAAKAGKGVRSSLLATTRRRDGKLQVTYAGNPLYYYEHDTKAGQIGCQNVSNFGGLWLVVAPNGKPVR
jgi:predicted lipoprotein with Yx(FWY)xxD motif